MNEAQTRFDKIDPIIPSMEYEIAFAHFVKNGYGDG